MQHDLGRLLEISLLLLRSRKAGAASCLLWRPDPRCVCRFKLQCHALNAWPLQTQSRRSSPAHTLDPAFSGGWTPGTAETPSSVFGRTGSVSHLGAVPEGGFLSLLAET